MSIKIGWLDTGDVKPRRFVIPCPLCAPEDRASAPGSVQSAEMCDLCCGYLRVPRTAAERYELSRGRTAWHPVVAYGAR
jgi:hypothetical protein